MTTPTKPLEITKNHQKNINDMRTIVLKNKGQCFNNLKPKIPIRCYSPVVISEKVQQALNDKKVPVVSLESTIITHGLPFPENLAMAKQAERIVEENGAIAATCAFIQGVPYVGLTMEQLEYLAEKAQWKNSINKVSRRDIGYTMAHKLNGGTTIALTMILSHKAGIKVFATGGLGGVHKDGQNTMDVSADLLELGRTPVSVVCSGPKSILDIGLTMEYLETQGVFVGTYNDNGRADLEVPGFYCRNSGVKSPYSFASPTEAASVIYNNTSMKLQSGNVLCIPPPENIALPSEFINRIIEEATESASKLGVKGKEVTPFLLEEISTRSQGKSVECNINFVYNNARFATEVAKELSRIETSNEPHHKSPIPSILTPAAIDLPKVKQNITDKVDTVIIGSIALDSISTFKNSHVAPNNSNPAIINSSVGGVAHNISLAHNYALESYTTDPAGTKTECSYRLVSVVADDLHGLSILSQLERAGMDNSGLLIQSCKKNSTAQYIAIHDKKGDLVTAAADMAIIEDGSFADHIIHELTRAEPKLVIVDCNLTSETLNRIFSFIKNKMPNADVIIEPTSPAKSTRISKVSPATVGVFPQNLILLISPTVLELQEFYSSMRAQDYFNDFEHWFPLLDSLGVGQLFRDQLVSKKNDKHQVLTTALQEGYLQQSFQILPYIPNIVLKLGDKGVLVITLSFNVKDYKSIPTTSPYKPEIMVCSQGKEYINEDGESKQLGVAIQYFNIPRENENLTIRNTTGAGDTFLGFLTASLSETRALNLGITWLTPELLLIEQEWLKWEQIYKSQLASGLSLQSDASVSPEIARLK